MSFSIYKSGLRKAGAVFLSLFAACGVAMADSSVTLVTAPTTATLPDGRVVPMWGYSCTATTSATCTALGIAPVPPATAWQPPVITVPAGKLTITLTNNLSFTPVGSTTPNTVPTSIVIDGQLGGGLGSDRATSPSPLHAPQGTTWPGSLGSLDSATTAVTVASGGAGYSTPPSVSITGGSGTGATALATIANGVVVGVTVSSPGTGYASGDTLTVTIDPPPCTPSATCVQATATISASTLASSDGSATFVPPPQVDRVRSLATEVAAGSSKDLVWNNLSPGTYLLHSGTQTSIQHTMGLYAVLVVTDPSGKAYNTAFDKDVPLLLSEIDPAQNDAVNLAVNTVGFTDTAAWNGQSGQCGDPTVHTCYPPVVNYSPLYYLVNGVAFDRTNIGASTLSIANPVTAGNNVLLRFVNAGIRMHVPSVVNATLTLLAEDGNPLPGAPRKQNSVLLTAGKTYDVTITPTADSTYAIYDRQLSLSTGNARDGGMQAYLKLGSGAANTAGSSASGTSLAAGTPKVYYCSAGTTLSITDASLGLLAGTTGASGVSLVSTTLTADAGATFNLQSNGTFTYTPSSPTVTACGATVSYKINGTLAAIAQILQCDVKSSSAAGCTLAPGPIAGKANFISNVASRFVSTPPGVMAGVTNPGGLKLTASGTGVNADGSFTVAGPGAAANCSTWDTAQGALPTGATCAQVPYTVTNIQGTKSSATATVAFLPASNLKVNVVDAKNGTAINDYRWIIEEDRTFWVDTQCQVNSTDPKVRPSTCPPLPVESLGYNFHSSHMPVIAQGCVGTASCENAQTVLDTNPFLADGKTANPNYNKAHIPAVCDIGNGICRTDAVKQTPLLPSDVHLDPSKRYFISVLPGDSVNPTIGGPGAMQVDPNCDPTKGTCAMRQFDILKDCGPYTGPSGAWEPAGTNAMCGHGMTGSQIRKELLATTNPSLTLKAQETPLPTAKISVLVFEDDNPLNGENDAGGGVDVIAPNEPGLGGFEIKLFDQAGQLGDNTGQITYDEFNQPVSNALAGTIDPFTKKNACPITQRPDGLVGMIPTCPKYEDDGVTPSPLAGQAVIANLYPGLYEIQAYPAADRIARGEEWLQTNTLDGGKPHEAFIKPNEPGYFQEFGPGGFHVSIGYANPKIINDRLAGYCASAFNGGQPCDKKLTVHISNNHMSRTPDQRTYKSETYDHYAFTNCYVSIGPADGEDFAFAKCSADGTAVFNNIPNGTYKISVFDQWNDIMLDGLVGTVSVSGDTEKDFPVTQWRTNLYTRTFIDANGDGVSGVPDTTGVKCTFDASGNPTNAATCNPNYGATVTDTEPGLALVNTNIRYRDGSIAFFNNTDLNGYAAWNEVFPFMNWLVVETTSTRYKPTGVHSVYDAGGPVDCSMQAMAAGMPCSNIAANLANTQTRTGTALPADLRMPGAKYCDDADCFTTAANGASTGTVFPPQPFGTTMGWQGLLGQNTFMEFGVKPFKPGENGGISGQVIYASTRPFDDPSLLLQLSWEPGVPNAKVNLYAETVDASGNQQLRLVDTTTSASFDAWAQGFRKNPDGSLMLAADGKSYVPNMNCPGQDATSPFFATLKNSKMWLDDKDPLTHGSIHPLAYNSQFKCYDGWSQLNQAQPAPYDGKYSFPSVNTVGTDGKPAGTPGVGTNCHLYTAAEPWGCMRNTAAAPTDWDYNKPMLVPGKYVVEVVVPAGYELVKEEDKNILLGDVYVAPVTQQFAGFGNVFIMPDQATVNSAYNRNNPGNLNLTSNLGSVTFPRHEGDTGSIEAYWPCVGAERIVPDFNSLYPQAGQAAPFAGAKRRLCDRKEVQVDDQSAALAKFYVFSSTHIAGHFTGTITNDFASEFDPFSPQFGEKFGPPNLPVGVRDFSGNEVARVYSDQWGIYNGLFFSTWTVNPPNPTGYAPQMSVACMNDPGPILAADGVTMITDPSYNPAYSNFCYEQPFMPGTTTYMDTPVIPTQAFADGYNLPDSELPDGTPAILKVSGDGNIGPWVAASGGSGGSTVSGVTLVIHGAGYTATPAVSFTGNGGASAIAVLSPTSVASVTLATGGLAPGGVYFAVPTVAITGGGGSGAVATPYIGVGTVRVTNSGSYATNVTPTVSFDLPPCTLNGTTCVRATGTANMGSVRGVRGVNSVTIGNRGAGYTGLPGITFGSGAASASTLTMRVTVVTLDNSGSGYTGVPTVTFSGGGNGTGLAQAQATATLAPTSVASVTLTGGGSGYTTPPTVTIAAPSSCTINTTTCIRATATAAIATSGQLTITALGAKVVQNPNFSGPNATTAPYNQKTITRNYGFGTRPSNCSATGNCPAVTIGGVAMTNVTTWNDTTITGSVPSGVPLCNASNSSYKGANATARCGELVITRADNGKQSIDAITVTIGGTRPWTVTPTAVTDSTGTPVADNGANFGRMGFSPIQTAIDKANPGDLILVQPGTYKENLIMWKPVRLQGVGAAAVTINADAHPAGKMDQWRRQINCVFGLDLNGVPNLNDTAYDTTGGGYTCPTGMHQRVDRIPFEALIGWDASGNGNLAQVLQEPTLMGSYEGAGITVLGRGVRAPSCSDRTFGANCHDFWGQNATGGAGAFTDGSVYLGSSNADCTASPTSADGTDYGTSNFYCNPSRIDGVSIINSSQGGGALFVHGWAQNLEIANTRIAGNQGTLAGAINLGNGETPDAFINDGVECGTGLTGANAVVPCPPIPANTALGAAIPFQLNTNVRIHHNMLYNNASIGDALFSGTPAGAGGVTVSAGADGYRIDHNWIAGNLSTGDGGGIQHLGLVFNGKIDHNFVLYNQSTNPTLPTNGGGIVVEGANLDRQLNGTECGSTTDQDCPPGLGEGSGPNTLIDANLILGNSAESGSGGGLRLQQVNGSADLVAFPTTNSQWYGVTLTNNIVANNVAGYDGGGISLQDALKVTMVNNTVASNDTTASAGALFKTLGAIMSNTPPPGCTPTTDPTLPQNPNCLIADAPHGPQPSGLVISGNTVNLKDALVGISLTCPTGYGYNADCTKVSKPAMVNNLFWQNRTFSPNIVDQFGNVVSSTNPTGTGNQSQQNLIALTPALVQKATGDCPAGANIWDIGLRTDDVNSGMIPPSTRLALSNSLYTGDAKTKVVVGNVSSLGTNQTPSTTPLVASFCNGARMPPEHCTDGGIDNGSPSCKGYNAPVGASETTGLTQVFVFSGIQPTATVDEGHNWLNLTYGPLTLTKPNVAATTPGEAMLVPGTSGLGTTLGAYSIARGTAAVGNGATGNGLPAAVANDFFGNARTINGSTKLDIGAVALTTTSASVRPTALAFGTVAIGSSSTQTITLTAGGTQLTGISFAFNPTTTQFTQTGGCTTLLANASCTFSITFKPTVAGVTPSTTASITANVPILGSPVALTGNGLSVNLNPSPSSLVFAPLTINTTSASQTVTVTNTGTLTVTGGVTATVAGSGFALATSPGTCPTTTSLAAGATCTVNVVFKPTAGGSASGTVSIAASPAFVAAHPGFAVGGPVSLIGTGLLPPPTLVSLAPTSVTRNTTSVVTLTGQYFTGATAVNVSGAGVTVTTFAVVNDTTITATINASATAPTGARTVTVTTPIGTSGTASFNVVNPPAPKLTSIAPTGGARGTTVTVTFNGSSLSTMTGVNAGNNITVRNIVVVSDTQATADLVISGRAALGNRNLSVTNPGGTSGNLNFTVQ